MFRFMSWLRFEDEKDDYNANEIKVKHLVTQLNKVVACGMKVIKAAKTANVKLKNISDVSLLTIYIYGLQI